MACLRGSLGSLGLKEVSSYVMRTLKQPYGGPLRGFRARALQNVPSAHGLFFTEDSQGPTDSERPIKFGLGVVSWGGGGGGWRLSAEPVCSKPSAWPICLCVAWQTFFYQTFTFLDVIQSLNCAWLFVTPWTRACQASLSFNCSIHVHWFGDVIQPSHPLLPLSPPAFNFSQHQSLFQSVGSSHQSMWPKYWSFSFSISPSSEYSGLISFRIDWFDLLPVQGTFLLSLWTVFLPFSAPDLYPLLLTSGWHTSFNCLTVFDPLMSIRLPHVQLMCLMSIIIPAKEPKWKKEKVPPLQPTWWGTEVYDQLSLQWTWNEIFQPQSSLLMTEFLAGWQFNCDLMRGSEPELLK